jgi:deoxyribose-phosphate aldolase
MKNKYQEVFAKFETVGTASKVTEQVNKIQREEAQRNFTPATLRFIHGCIDATSLSALDTKESI